jgi:hypothetical protein
MTVTEYGGKAQDALPFGPAWRSAVSESGEARLIEIVREKEDRQIMPLVRDIV